MATYSCEICHAAFKAKPYRKQRTCSQKCNGVILAKERRGVLMGYLPFAPYTDAETETMVGLARKGLTAAQITPHFPGRTETAIRAHLVRLRRDGKLKPFREPPEPPPPPAPITLIAGCIPVGLHRAWQWWAEQGRQGRPEIGEINDLRRRMKRAPFTLMRGRFTGISP